MGWKRTVVPLTMCMYFTSPVFGLESTDFGHLRLPRSFRDICLNVHTWLKS